MRKLATIAQIENISPIENADAIELAKVRGWNVVIKKGEFKVGDKAVYCEIDSVLPNRPEFQFLSKYNFRIKSVKLRGVISQGILFPFGDDVTEILGVKLYEPPIPANLSGEIKGKFPSFIPKTDEERIQNLEWILTEPEYKDLDFYVTEKLDGTSFTCYYNNGEFGVCSRNYELKENDKNTHWLVARKLKLEEILKDFGKNVSLQGELVGPGIQGNKYKLTEQTVFFFNIFDIDNQQYLDFNELQQFCTKYGLNTVPLLQEDYRLHNKLDEILQFADGFSVLNKSQRREGLVIRPVKTIYVNKNDFFGRLSFKVISNTYLLKNE
jgi:RNA ligase (TIGR02306 family)